MYRLLSSIICLTSIFTGVYAQKDTLVSKLPMSGFQRSVDKSISSKAYQMCYVGVPLIAAGLIVKGEDDHFRQLRNDYIPKFKFHYDDYTQYLPAGVMLGLKAAGVESRSSWSRMLVSDAFTVALMASSVNLIKATAGVKRPDGSNSHSFPSGHTATAFMTATMLSKEYGHKSPWYSIGAYTVAAATGFTRIANNKHWMSDILAGAGIGILSTELGYYLADLIFKKKGLNWHNDPDLFSYNQNPSFVGIYLGFNIAPGDYTLPDNNTLSFSSGSTAGFEGAWFCNPYFGVGGRLSASAVQLIYNDEIQDETMNLASVNIGPYFSYPLIPRVHIGLKALAGYTHYPCFDEKNIHLKQKGSFNWGGGISFNVIPQTNLGVRLFLDYTQSRMPFETSQPNFKMLTTGAVVSLML